MWFFSLNNKLKCNGETKCSRPKEKFSMINTQYIKFLIGGVIGWLTKK